MPKIEWHRRHVIEILTKLRIYTENRGKRPSAVEMADHVHDLLWKGLNRGNARCQVIISELVRQSLVQLAGKVNRDSEAIGWSRNGKQGKVSAVAVTRRDQDGNPTKVRETPRWKQMTFFEVQEVYDRMASQVSGLNIHLVQLQAVLELFRKDPAAITVDDVCQNAGVDPYDMDLDQILGMTS